MKRRLWRVVRLSLAPFAAGAVAGQQGPLVVIIAALIGAALCVLPVVISTPLRAGPCMICAQPGLAIPTRPPPRWWQGLAVLWRVPVRYVCAEHMDVFFRLPSTIAELNAPTRNDAGPVQPDESD